MKHIAGVQKTRTGGVPAKQKGGPMLKILIALVILGVGLAVYMLGLAALIAVIGVSLGLLLGEAMSFTSAPRDDDARVIQRQGRS